jgi:hypothetical protein
MRWILKPIMRPMAKRRLVELYADRDRIQKAINSARKSKGRVSDLYDISKRMNLACHHWERWI